MHHRHHAAALAVCLSVAVLAVAPAGGQKGRSGKPPGPAPRKTPVPSPSPFYPLPPPGERAQARLLAARLLARQKQGVLVLVNRERDRRYLEQAANRGHFVAPDGRAAPASLAMLRTLDGLAARSTRQRPLELLSLFRPPTSLRRGSAHGRGEALDISAFGGFPINSRNRRNCTEGVLALLRALPAGRDYRIGLPRPAVRNPEGLRPPPRRPKTWPFFPAPLPRTTVLFGTIRVVVPRRDASGNFAYDARRNALSPEIRRWENERAAPLSDVGSPRVRRAVANARRRGANVYLLFPDAADHVHVDVVRASPRAAR